jgi:cation transport protein ChaC
MPPRAVTREAIERGMIEEIVAGADPELVALTKEQREESLRTLLAGHDPAGDVWLFAYGSLIWNPALATVERRPARIFGYHRRLCLLTRVARGTPAAPGLLFGLDRGGSCRGIAFRIAAAEVEAELAALWRREMVDEAYLPRWTWARDGDGRALRCVTFVMNRGHRRYAGRLDADETAQLIGAAHGAFGSCADYVREAASSFAEERIDDPLLRSVASRLAAQRGPSAAGQAK